MSNNIEGIHHVTVITTDAQRNVDFHTDLLGLRLVKRTVNVDDPGAYHLYYGGGVGTPVCAIDETPAELGTGLMLPPWLEPRRAAIESVLPPRLPALAGGR